MVSAAAVSHPGGGKGKRLSMGPQAGHGPDAHSEPVIVEEITQFPPRETWHMSGVLWKKMISSAGIRFQPRFVVLTGDILAFSRAHDRGGGQSTTAATNPAPQASGVDDAQVNNFRAVFDEFDKDNNGTLEASELKMALLQLGLFRSQQDFERLFVELDTDQSGSLDWDEFKVFATRATMVSRLRLSRLRFTVVARVARMVGRVARDSGDAD